MATEQDAARLRVLAARSEFAEQVELLEASARSAVDIPAKIRRSPAKAAAIAAAVGFLAVRGPQRLFGATRRTIRGKPEPMPSRMLPDEIERSLRKLGDDGEKVRGTLERDFAEYAKKSQQARSSLRTVLLLAVARPLLGRAARAAGELLLSTDQEDLSTRLAQIRERAGEGAGRAREGEDLAGVSAQERIAVVRRREGEDDSADVRGQRPPDETAPTGI